MCAYIGLQICYEIHKLFSKSIQVVSISWAISLPDFVIIIKYCSINLLGKWKIYIYENYVLGNLME